ncbi:tail fiber protein [Comamonas sp. MYb21]|uniref:phage tail protein n=1 Tax=unclassified Comamonas TaxID=2638500 RepID=UPI000420929D|nr:tail fiber protein [Comamonas sp. B-9]
MSTPYVGEIRMFGFGRVPNGWFTCDGSLKSIADYEVLYTLLGTTYGGDGVSTFAVPDLRGRLPIHQGSGPGLTPRAIGQIAGTEAVTLAPQHMPAHIHAVAVSTAAATSQSPASNQMLAAISGDGLYATEVAGDPIATSSQTVGTVGGSQPHENTMPTLAVNFCMAWAGIYPSQG